MGKSCAIALGLALLMAAVSDSRAGSLGVAWNYNEFIFQNSTRVNVNSEGQVAVGGNAKFNNFTIGTTVTKSNIYGTESLIVGGNLSGSQAVLSGYGNAEYGSKSINHLYYNGGGTGAVGDSSDLFSTAEAYLKKESASLAGLSANGFTTTAWGGITLTGTDAKLDVFILSGDVLSRANSLTISAPTTATIVVNIDGKSDAMRNFGFTLKGGIDASQILYNFYEASSLAITGIAVQGSVLAPLAAVNFGNGQLNGNLIANSLSGSGTTLNHLFKGTLPSPGAIPEPSSVAMLLTGCTLASWPILKRRTNRIS